MAANPATTLSLQERLSVKYSTSHRICCGGLFRNPLRFLRWTGLLKYQPISHSFFNTDALDTPPLFNAPPPRSADHQPWAVSQPSGDQMNHVVTIEKGLATCYGYIFDHRGRLIEGATHKHREGGRYPEWLTRREQIRPHRLFPDLHVYADQIAILTASTQHLYFHWLFDVLPRLAMIEEEIRDGCRIFAAVGHRFQRETLSLLGIDPERIIDVAVVPVLTAPKLIVPCHQIMKGREFPDWVLAFLRERLMPQGEPHPFPGATRIYISRQGTPTRKPTNESAIIARLEALGFVAVELEKLRLPEQISLFRDARVVVAPHGAGLANLVYCSPDTTVVELFPAANSDLYYRLCAALGLKYFFAKGPDGDPAVLTPANYYIDGEIIERTLKIAKVL